MMKQLLWMGMDEEERARAFPQRSWPKPYLPWPGFVSQVVYVKRESKDGHCLIA